MPERTLRGRVSLVALGVIAAWVVLLAVAFDVVAAARIRGQRDDRLRVRAQAASTLITVVHGRITGVRESASDSELDAGTWVYAGPRLIRHPPVSPGLQRAVDRAATGSGFVSADAHRLYVLPVRSAGQRLATVVAGVSTDSADDAEQTVLVGSAVVAVLVLVGAYPVLRIAAGRALQPVGRMATQAAEWSSSAAPERFGDSQQYAELRLLARRLDELLDRLGAVLRHERQLSGELSHELRTPLTRLLGEIDLLREQCSPETAQALAAMRASCLEMDAIIDAALAATRTELVGRSARTALDEVLPTYATATPPSVHVPERRTGLAVGVERGVVTRILNAVVDNARRHAAAAVSLTAAAVGGQVVITVEDDGPGVPAGDAERIFEPGYTRTDGPHAGAGLGLALGRRLARAADGDLRLDPDAPRTRFVLTLPRG